MKNSMHVPTKLQKNAKKAPVLILDPRAGHGAVIGGFKHDSELGMAIHEGHPTYFASFFPVPAPIHTCR